MKGYICDFCRIQEAKMKVRLMGGDLSCSRNDRLFCMESITNGLTTKSYMNLPLPTECTCGKRVGEICNTRDARLLVGMLRNKEKLWEKYAQNAGKP